MTPPPHSHDDVIFFFNLYIYILYYIDYIIIIIYYKLAAPRKGFIWPPFFEYDTRLLRQKTGGACLYMPQDGHWLASFEVIPPPKKVSFPAAKKMKIPH